jgi:hypothetical protein
MPLPAQATALLVAMGAASVSATNSTAPQKIQLGALNIQEGSVTVSGLSSGGFMSVKIHVAYSSLINGVGVFSGGPYYCAQNNLGIAEEECMYGLMGVRRQAN